MWEPEYCECHFELLVEPLPCEQGMFDSSFELIVWSGLCLWYWDLAELTINGNPHDLFILYLEMKNII